METKRLNKDDIQLAATLLKEGNLLGLPTETVYGLGANGLNPQATQEIFRAKGRPQDNPLILHLADASWITRYCQNIPEDVYRLTEAFWPGPLTLILESKPCVPKEVTAGLTTVGVRCPNHPLALEVIALADLPIAAPSGNLSGKPSPTTAEAMFEDMNGKISAILDGGPCTVGVESTILSFDGGVKLLRAGGVSVEDLERILGKSVALDIGITEKSDTETPMAPGMKYRHYAPKAPVTVVLGENSDKWIARQAKAGDGVICFEESKDLFPQCITQILGKENDFTAQAQQVFSVLRAFDDTSVTKIWSQCPQGSGLALAVANRLKKASGFQIIDLGDGTDFMKIFGITGQTGAGKTTLLQVIQEKGGTIIDCDALYWDLLKENQALKADLITYFGEIADEIGEIDRKKLGAKVFGQADQLEKLNQITHPYVLERVAQLIESAEKTGQKLVGIDAIALIESGLSNYCHSIIAVTAKESTRIQRIMARDAISLDYATQRAKAQKDETFYRKNADHIIENVFDTKEEFSRYVKDFFDITF